PVTCTPASGSVFPLGRTHVACTAVDVAGNRSEGGFSVLVADTTPPVIASAADVAAEQASAAGTVIAFPTPAARDACDASPSVLCVPASGSIFPLGVTTVTC